MLIISSDRYTIMNLCWARNPKARPTFVEIIEMLLPDVETTEFHTVSYYHGERSQKRPPSQEDAESTPLNSASKDAEDNDGDKVPVKFFPNPSNQWMFPASTDPREGGEAALQIDNDSEDNSCAEGDVAKKPKGEKANGTSLVKRVRFPFTDKGASIQSSDGSKGSKISSATSNGSLVNGHIPSNTTTC